MSLSVVSIHRSALALYKAKENKRIRSSASVRPADAGYDDVILCLFRQSANGAMWGRTELSVGGNFKGLYTSAHKKFINSFPHVKDEIRQR